jgi:hypothetical protein
MRMKERNGPGMTMVVGVAAAARFDGGGDTGFGDGGGDGGNE